MSRLALAFVVVGCAASVSACSALGLDRIPIPTCDTSSDCDVINDADGVAADACERYFCALDRRGRRTCVFGPEDADGDGVPKCGVMPVDCDDARDTVSPMAIELACNGRDDDCDGVIDDDGFATATRTVVPSLGEIDRVSFAGGSDGVSAAAWSAGGAGSVVAVGAASDAVASVVHSSTSRDGLTSLSDTSREPGCILRVPGAISCPAGAGVTCNGPGADGLPWLANLAGDGHVCGATGCDVCDDDLDCGANTLPRTCNRTATSRACAPRSVASAPELGPSNCCAGQVLSSGASPAVGTDAAACCDDEPRACVRGVCRDVCTTDADCPLLAFESGTPRPVYGVCVGGACVPPTRPDLEAPSTCNVGDVALDRIGADGSWVVATVSTRGCAAGQLRVGVSPADALGDVYTSGPEARSNVFAGVDVDVVAMGCSGASRADGVRGASRPAVAALPSVGTEAGQALVVALARPIDAVACAGSDTYAVEALGVRIPDDEPLALHATGDGAPVSLGRTPGIGRPAVAAVAPLGWVVGFGTATGLTLRVLPALAPVPELAPRCSGPTDCEAPEECLNPGDSDSACRAPCVDSSDCGTDALTCCTSTTACTRGTLGHCVPTNRAHVPRPATTLEVVGSDLAVPSDAADYVRIAVGPVSGTRAMLGVAFQTGCGAAGHVWFVRVQVDLATGALVETGPVLDLGVGQVPAVAFVADGVLRLGSTTPEGDIVDDALDGGWLVAWATSSGAVARRVDERGARAVDAAPVPVSDATSSAIDGVHVFASAAPDARLELVFAEVGATAAVRTGLLSCRPSAD